MMKLREELEYWAVLTSDKRWLRWVTSALFWGASKLPGRQIETINWDEIDF